MYIRLSTSSITIVSFLLSKMKFRVSVEGETYMLTDSQVKVPQGSVLAQSLSQSYLGLAAYRHSVRPGTKPLETEDQFSFSTEHLRS
jgi:hypothetical protein